MPSVVSVTPNRSIPSRSRRAPRDGRSSWHLCPPRPQRKFSRSDQAGLWSQAAHAQGHPPVRLTRPAPIAVPRRRSDLTAPPPARITSTKYHHLRVKQTHQVGNHHAPAFHRICHHPRCQTVTRRECA